MDNATTSALGQYYGDNWYEDHVAASLDSGRLVLGHLWQYLQPASVLDVGCGRGSWLAACRELGAETLIGLDGPWNSQAAMIEPAIQFRAVDLNQPFALDAPVELAMSVEVAEHLEPSSSERLIECLTSASEVVVFGAAYVEQGGTHHINERRHSFWAKLFAARGFAVFDLFRPNFWDDARLPFWYRQNTFLYVKRNSRAFERLTAAGLHELRNIAFTDCVHPELFDAKAGVTISFRQVVRQFVPSLARSIRAQRSRRKRR